MIDNRYPCNTFRTELVKYDEVLLRADAIQMVDIDLYIVSMNFYDDQPAEWQLYDYQQEKFIGPKLKNVWPFYNEVACVRLENSLFNFVRRDGSFLFPVHFAHVESKMFSSPIMDAIIKGHKVRIAITGGIDITDKELAKIILKEE